MSDAAITRHYILDLYTDCVVLFSHILSCFSTRSLFFFLLARSGPRLLGGGGSRIFFFFENLVLFSRSLSLSLCGSPCSVCQAVSWRIEVSTTLDRAFTFINRQKHFVDLAGQRGINGYVALEQITMRKPLPPRVFVRSALNGRMAQVQR